MSEAAAECFEIFSELIKGQKFSRFSGKKSISN